MASYTLDSISINGKLHSIVKEVTGSEARLLWQSDLGLDTHDQAVRFAARWLENHIGKSLPPHLEQKMNELLSFSQS